MKKHLFCFIMLLMACFIEAQELRNPFNYPILLSGNFGELRSNHFHSGIDFKTQGVEGKPVHAVADGFVSRISVTPGGYGNALYIDHPDGTTTVYGHLLSFPTVIAAYVKEQQYEQESFSVNLKPAREQFPVKKGELIALSGNTGSSGGPHLHFEIRDTKTEEVLDPIMYYRDRITDTKPPRIQGIMVYPVVGEGVVNGSKLKQAFTNMTVRDGVPCIAGKIEAWGKIGLGVKAYDYMDNTHHIYGVKEIVLKADSQVIFHSEIDRFPITESRALNSFTDYADWIENRSFYMKSFIEPGNRLPFLKGRNRGYITIYEERVYHLEYILADAYGNTARLFVEITGKEQTIPSPDAVRERFYWAGDNRFGAKGIRLSIPKGNLYDDIWFRYKVKEDSTRLSATHILHDSPVALHRYAQLSLHLQKDTLQNKNQYGIVRQLNGRTSWIGGTYRNGWLDASIRELGQYALAQDVTPPVIHPIEPAKWMSRQCFVFRLTDNLSGVKTYRGEIDGQYVLFERDNKSVITYRFDKERLQHGQHLLRLIVTDNCGNETVYEHSFDW